MPSANTNCDVAVVGGGVIGLAVAWRAAVRHRLAVSVVDDAPGSGASGVAAGLLAPVSEVHYGEEPLLALTMESARRWPAFATEVSQAAGADIGYRTEGTLVVARDGDDLVALEELARFQRALGLEVHPLTGRKCRALEPLLSPRTRGGMLVPGDHQVDPRRLVAALRTAGEAAGVRLHRDRVDAFEPPSAVRLAGGGRLEAATVVLAAGCWSARLGGLPAGAVAPVRPVKGQVLRLRYDPADPPLGHNLRALVAGRSVYLVPRADGELVVGASVEERGFDTTVTAGAVRELLDDATEALPAVSEMALTETIAGLRPGTPDNAPILGPAPGAARLVLATGHHRNGILLAPVTADAIADVAAGGAPPAVISAFGIERFPP